MGLKIFAVGGILLGISMMGVAIPAILVALLLILGGIGILAGY